MLCDRRSFDFFSRPVLSVHVERVRPESPLRDPDNDGYAAEAPWFPWEPRAHALLFVIRRARPIGRPAVARVNPHPPNNATLPRGVQGRSRLLGSSVFRDSVVRRANPGARCSTQAFIPRCFVEMPHPPPPPPPVRTHYTPRFRRRSGCFGSFCEPLAAFYARGDAPPFADEA